jgi:asparagine synthase (glutamine-hydrolysing)
MGGFCGLSYTDVERVPESTILQRMCQTMRHRGPDGEGFHVDGGIGLGARVLQLRHSNAAQPASNDRGTVWVMLDGDVFVHESARDVAGLSVITESDAGAIARLYEKFGVDFIQKTDGQFAIAVWDTERRTLHLFRDRIGCRPLFYFHKSRGLTFASTVSATDCRPEVDLGTIDALFSFGFVPHPKTMFRGISQVNPGHVLTWRDGHVTERCYWEFRYGEPEEMPDDSYAERLRELIHKAVAKRVECDAPFGSFLSGGVDSSTVVGMMTQILGPGVKAFSVGFEEEEYDELGDARIVARHCGAELHETVLKPEMVPPVFENIVRHHEVPFHDTSCLPTYFGAKSASEHIRLVLTGDAPDQLMAGSGKHKFWTARAERDKSLIRRSISRLGWSSAKLLGFQPVTTSLQDKVLRKLYRDSLPIEHEFFEHQSRAQLFLKQALYSPDLLDIGTLEDPFEIARPYFEKVADRSFLEQILFYDISFYLPDDLMVKVDRMTMAHSLTARYPYTDAAILEFAGLIPDRLKLKRNRDATTKFVLKKAARDMLPERPVAKPKQGFAVPLEEWLRTPLSGYVKDILLDNVSLQRGYFNERFLRDMLNRFFKQQTDHSTGSATFLVCLLTVELWHRIFIDGADTFRSAQ